MDKVAVSSQAVLLSGDDSLASERRAQQLLPLLNLTHPLGLQVSVFPKMILPQLHLPTRATNAHMILLFRRVFPVSIPTMLTKPNRPFPALTKDLFKMSQRSYQRILLAKVRMTLLHHLSRGWEAQLTNNLISQKSSRQFKIDGLRSERMPLNEQHRERVKSRVGVDIVRRLMGRMERLVVKRVSIIIPYCLHILTNRIAIESRVARIKARVAELTGNMETGGSPAASSRPSRRP
jgi:hypothetical protein